jgi:copper homeostasis protein
MTQHIPLEIVVKSDSPADAHQNAAAAMQAGADRIEVCAAMQVEGLTAGADAIKAARAAFGERPGLMVMVRPRDGEFSYTDAELALMQRQISQAASAGANGVVIGALTPGHKDIDRPATDRLVSHAHRAGVAVTYHRAIDALNEARLEAAIEHLILLGVARILTSGVAWGTKGTALDGLARLQTMAARCGKHIELVIAGGMSEVLAPRVLAALPASGRYSVHAYTSVLTDGITDPQKIRALKHVLLP